MRFTMFGFVALGALALARTDAHAQDDPPPLHAEKGLRERIAIEETTSRMFIIDRKTDTPLAQAGRYEFRRFLIGNVLHGTQARKLDPHVLDDFQCLTAAHPWDNLAALGAIHAFDVRQ